MKETQQIYRQTKKSAGADLTAAENVTIDVNETVLVPTGYFLPESDGQEIFYALAARSSIAYKKNLLLMNGLGIIDADYKEEVKVMYRNLGTVPVQLLKGERIAQLIALEYLPVFPAVDQERQGGFGSSGTGI